MQAILKRKLITHTLILQKLHPRHNVSGLFQLSWYKGFRNSACVDSSNEAVLTRPGQACM